MNAGDTVKVMKHLGNLAKLDFHEYLGQISQILSVNFCQWKVAACRFNLVTEYDCPSTVLKPKVS